MKNKGIAKALKVKKRTEAIARQQKNIDRGYYIDRDGSDRRIQRMKCTPAPIDEF